MARMIELKTSVALTLSGLDVSAKVLQSLVGREKPVGQHHMRYTPGDLRTARYRMAGIAEPPADQVSLVAGMEGKLPPLIVTRMTRGGVGKTALTVNCAAAIAMMGFRVLLIDGDPQATATNLCGVDSSLEQLVHIGNFLTRTSRTPDADLPAALIPIYEGGFLTLLAADISLAETDARLMTQVANHERALRFLERNQAYLAENFDVILVDTAPGTTPSSLAFTYAAKVPGRILTVMEPEGSCLKALESLEMTLNELKEVTDAQVGFEIVINQFNGSLRHVKENMATLYANYPDKLCDTIVSVFAGFSRQFDTKTREGRPMIEREPSSTGAVDIIDVAKHLVRSYGITHPGIPPFTESQQ